MLNIKWFQTILWSQRQGRSFPFDNTIFTLFTVEKASFRSGTSRLCGLSGDAADLSLCILKQHALACADCTFDFGTAIPLIIIICLRCTPTIHFQAKVAANARNSIPGGCVEILKQSYGHCYAVEA